MNSPRSVLTPILIIRYDPIRYLRIIRVSSDQQTEAPFQQANGLPIVNVGTYVCMYIHVSSVLSPRLAFLASFTVNTRASGLPSLLSWDRSRYVRHTFVQKRMICLFPQKTAFLVLRYMVSTYNSKLQAESTEYVYVYTGTHPPRYVLSAGGYKVSSLQ